MKQQKLLDVLLLLVESAFWKDNRSRLNFELYVVGCCVSLLFYFRVRVFIEAKEPEREIPLEVESSGQELLLRVEANP